MPSLASMAHLNSLSLKGCRCISDSALIYLITTSGSLRHLNIHGCSFTDESIILEMIKSATEKPHEQFSLTISVQSELNEKVNSMEIPENFSLLKD